jgi:hypothetical protein
MLSKQKPPPFKRQGHNPINNNETQKTNTRPGAI